MNLLPEDILTTLRASSLPGTFFVEFDSFSLQNGHAHKIVLAIIKREEGWGNPTYVTLIEIKEGDSSRWIINPWLSEELIEHYVKLPTPKRAVSRIPPELIEQLVAGVVTFDSAVTGVKDVIRKVEENYERAK